MSVVFGKVDQMLACSNISDCVRLDFIALVTPLIVYGLSSITVIGAGKPNLSYVGELHLVRSRFCGLA